MSEVKHIHNFGCIHYDNCPNDEIEGEKVNRRFTPGPWKIGLRKNGDSNTILDNNGKLIAEWFGESFHIGSQYKLPKREEALANAELIAKAPDMALELERLRAVNAELLEACKDAFEVVGKDYPECVGLLGILESAIAKAEGRA